MRFRADALLTHLDTLQRTQQGCKLIVSDVLFLYDRAALTRVQQ
jgi:hypothetical protein